jgi:YD repeat-containing protein
MGRWEKIAFIGAALACAAAAMASETITYRYDARGRLVKVDHTGNVNNGITTSYTYDKAENRANVTEGTTHVFSIGDATATEGNLLTFTVTKTGTTTQSCLVYYATVDGSATAPADYGSATGPLIFSAGGNASTSLTVATVADGAAEGPQTMRMTLANPNCGGLIADDSGTGTINDP